MNVTVRALPDEVHERLTARAARAGQSLQQYLAAELTRLASRPTTGEALHGVAERLRGFPPVQIPAEDLVGHVEADRR